MGIQGTRTGGGKPAPIIFFTNVRKIEPMGSDCVRIYCSVITDGKWDDLVILELPISCAVANSRLVEETAGEYLGTPNLAPTA